MILSKQLYSIAMLDCVCDLNHLLSPTSQLQSTCLFLYAIKQILSLNDSN